MIYFDTPKSHLAGLNRVAPVMPVKGAPLALQLPPATYQGLQQGQIKTVNNRVAFINNKLSALNEPLKADYLKMANLMVRRLPELSVQLRMRTIEKMRNMADAAKNPNRVNKIYASWQKEVGNRLEKEAKQQKQQEFKAAKKAAEQEKKDIRKASEAEKKAIRQQQIIDNKKRQNEIIAARKQRELTKKAERARTQDEKKKIQAQKIDLQKELAVAREESKREAAQVALEMKNLRVEEEISRREAKTLIKSPVQERAEEVFKVDLPGYSADLGTWYKNMTQDQQKTAANIIRDIDSIVKTMSVDGRKVFDHANAQLIADLPNETPKNKLNMLRALRNIGKNPFSVDVFLQKYYDKADIIMERSTEYVAQESAPVYDDSDRYTTSLTMPTYQDTYQNQEQIYTPGIPTFTPSTYSKTDYSGSTGYQTWSRPVYEEEVTEEVIEEKPTRNKLVIPALALTAALATGVI